MEDVDVQAERALSRRVGGFDAGAEFGIAPHRPDRGRIGAGSTGAMVASSRTAATLASSRAKRSAAIVARRRMRWRVLTNDRLGTVAPFRTNTGAFWCRSIRIVATSGTSAQAARTRASVCERVSGAAVRCPRWLRKAERPREESGTAWPSTEFSLSELESMRTGIWVAVDQNTSTKTRCAPPGDDGALTLGTCAQAASPSDRASSV